MGNNENEESQLDNQIKSIRRKGMYKDDVMNLVERDLRYGLSREQTLEYCENSKLNIKQMQIYSNLLHRNAPEEIKAFICNPEHNSSQMQVLYDYYVKGVPLDTMRAAIQKDDIPKHMSEVFQRYLNNVAEGKKEVTQSDLIREEEKPEDSSISEPDKEKEERVSDDEKGAVDDTEEPASTDKEKVSSEQETIADEMEQTQPPALSPEVLALLQRMDSRMEQQDKFYEQMSGTLDKIGKQKDDDDVTKSLLEKYNSQEALIVSQQDQLNEANRALARLRAEKETAERELQRLKDQQASMDKADKREAQEKQTDAAKETVTDTSQTIKEGGQTDMGLNQNVAAQPIPPLPKGTIPVYYQVPLTQNGRVVQQVEIERSYRKSVGGVGIFSRLFLKKKSRIDLVSRLASGDMLPEQLVQIRVAIEKGLHEEQLVELINHNVPVDKMKEIIEIAVLENSMA